MSSKENWSRRKHKKEFGFRPLRAVGSTLRGVVPYGIPLRDGVEPEAIGAYAYPPACKPYGLYGLEAAPAGIGNAEFRPC